MLCGLVNAVYSNLRRSITGQLGKAGLVVHMLLEPNITSPDGSESRPDVLICIAPKGVEVSCFL